jgi:hypothetical protein
MLRQLIDLIFGDDPTIQRWCGRCDEPYNFPASCTAFYFDRNTGLPWKYGQQGERWASVEWHESIDSQVARVKKLVRTIRIY